MFGNTSTDDKKEKPNTSKAEITVAINKQPPSKIPLKQLNSCSKSTVRNLETKESSVQESVPICQSLISPKTLLNGSTTPLWSHNGSRLVKTEPVTNSPTSLMINCTSPLSNNSFVLCSTTVGCLSSEPQPNQLPETGAKVGYLEEEGGETLSVEPEERCGSYDDVVLEGDCLINDTVAEYIPGFESGCYVWEEPDNSNSATDHFTRRDNGRTEKVSTSLSIKMSTSCANNNLSDQSNNTRKPLSDAHFAVPNTNTLGSRRNQHETEGLKKNLSDGKTNASSSFMGKTFVLGNTSTPNTSFARPKPGIAQHSKQKEISESFTIYTDPAKQAMAPSRPSSSCLYTPKNILSSLPVNTHPSSTNRSLIPLKLKEGWKSTSPLCACGRRAKRQVVSNGGPNHGRGFYCCPVRRSGSGGRIQKGCEFFKWESSLMKGSTVASSVSLCQINSTLKCHPRQSSTLRKSI